MRILVIEDEARILAFLARGLEAEGYAVGAAQDGREGLRLALGEAWDLVVIDLLRPRVPRSAPPGAASGRDRQPRASPRGGVGLRLRPAVERRRGVHPAGAAEARSRRADRNGAACGISAGCGVTPSSSRGAHSP